MTLEDLRRNRNLLFWGLHSLGWSAYLITQYLGALLYEKPASYVKVVLAAAAGGFLGLRSISMEEKSVLEELEKTLT